MQRRNFIRNTTLAATGLAASPSPLFAGARAARPNVLWILGEDLGPDLGCYGDPLVHTPSLDRLAHEGVRFTNAFAACPVCSPARSAMITGMFQTSIGAHHHRSHRRDGYTLPEGVRLITDCFRDSGYFTANVKQAAPGVKGTGKTDFNFNVDRPFDGDDWNQRAPGQPFYAQVNLKETHRTFQEDPDHHVDPQQVQIPPYYPDHPVTRRDWALYLETIGQLDKKVGAVLRRLEEEGLADNTLVFFLGDHGRCHVRGKQWLYEGGIHIPLIVRWPGKFHPGTVRDDLVSAIDITATSLSMAGIRPPAQMQGQPFFGPHVQEREYIVAARDRCDETMDRIRCVRTNRYKYIRNFFPERPYTQLNRYKELQYPVLRLMKRLRAEGQLTPAQARFMAATRPVEEVYDLWNDPHEIENLSGDPQHVETLNELSAVLDRWIVETGDQGNNPEDPNEIDFYLKRAKKNYDARIHKAYKREGMR